MGPSMNVIRKPQFSPYALYMDAKSCPPATPAGRTFALPSAMFLLAAWNCNTGKLPYSLLLTASLQSPRGVARVHANFNLSPLIYTAQDHSTAQVCSPKCQDPGAAVEGQNH